MNRFVDLKSGPGAVVVVGLLASCGVNCVIAAARKEPASQPIAVSPSQEVAWGERARGKFLQSHPLSEDGNLAVRVHRIGERVAKSSERPDLTYDLLVVQDDVLQAYSFPGGTICLTDALARLYPNDDELAFAIGHELAHIALRHHVSQLRLQEALKRGAPGTEAMLEAVQNRFDRDSEVEADKYGALYAVRAKFRFTASHEALQRLARATPGRREDGAHPDFEARIEALRGFKRELDLALEAFDKGKEALASGKAGDAISLFSLFVAAFPASAPGRVNLGSAYLARLSATSGTPQGLEEALPIVPKPDVVLRGGFDLLDLDKARENFERALRTQPDEANAQASMGVIHTRLSELAEARRYLTLANAAAPATAEFLLNLGNVEHLDGNYDAALSLYREALAARNDWPEAIKNLALTYERMDDEPQARDLWSRLVPVQRFGAEARLHLTALEAGSKDRQ